ncbi:MAG: hypothetical protein Q7J80_04240 [Anaerolineales bacterium]|nr:hypothetical protein [Anaerolineales bacterium]
MRDKEPELGPAVIAFASVFFCIHGASGSKICFKGVGQPGLAIPAAIVAGLGGIFYYQETANDYGSWSYMWALIPGFVGVGSVLAGLLGENTAHNIKRGLNLMVISAVLFLVFSSFLGGWALLGNFGPAILLILLGVWVLGSGLYRSFRKQGE